MVKNRANLLFLVKFKLRKATFIIISLIITVLITGNYFIYRQVTKAHKKEFKAFIRTKYAKTETLEICPSELYTNNSKITWLDHNKEVLVNDVMYDIVSISNGGTKVILTVVNDTYEKELMNRYKDQFNASAGSHKKNNSIAQDFFGMKYISSSYYILTSTYSETLLSNPVTFMIFSGYQTVLTPPPLA